MGATGNHDGALSKWGWRAALGLMGVFLTLVVFSVGLALGANGAAHEAGRKADKVASDLSVHEARQNGSLQSIQAHLSQLHTGQAQQDKVLDELLRRSYSGHFISPP